MSSDPLQVLLLIVLVLRAVSALLRHHFPVLVAALMKQCVILHNIHRHPIRPPPHTFRQGPFAVEFPLKHQLGQPFIGGRLVGDLSSPV